MIDGVHNAAPHTGRVVIDATFDVRTDAGGKDPDSHSAMLRHYHRLLWGKALPDGRPFELDAKLRHSSALGDFWLSSDSISHSYSYWTRPTRLVEVIRELPTSSWLQKFADWTCPHGIAVCAESKQLNCVLCWTSRRA